MYRVPVGRVGVAVGESPCHVAVAAGDDRRQARQADPGYIDATTGGTRIRIAQAHPEPQVRCAQCQMHVIGDDGAAIGGKRSAHRPVVAADRFLFCPPASGCGWRCRQFPQIELRGARQRRIATRLPEHGCVPTGAVVREQVVQRGRNLLADPPQRQFPLIAGILQIEIHGIAGERGIGDFPPARGLSQQQVGPRARAQVPKPAVDAVGVGLQRDPAVGDEIVQVLPQSRTQPMDPVFPIPGERCRPEQFRQFAGRIAAHQVHLEIALLRMHVTQCTHCVVLVGGVDGDHAERVALDCRRRLQAGQDRAAFQARETVAQDPPGRGQDAGRQREQQQRDAPDPCLHRDSLRMEGHPAGLFHGRTSGNGWNGQRTRLIPIRTPAPGFGHHARSCKELNP